MKHVGQLIGGNRYQQKLNSEEWRRFSRGVRNSKGNFCECCKMGNTELQVHHIYYDANREPWEYSTDELIVLCRGCHKDIHEQLNNFRKFVFGKMSHQSFRVLNGALAVAFEKYDPLVFAHALAEFVSTPRMVENFARAFGVPALKQDRPFVSGDAAIMAREVLRQYRDGNPILGIKQ